MSQEKLPNVNEVKKEVLETVWQLVQEKYPLFEIRNVRWNKQLLHYQKQLESVQSYVQLYELIDQMLLQLRDPHTRVIYTPYQEQKGVIPLILSCINGNYYVNQNPKGTILKPGMQIRSINGHSVFLIEQELFQRYNFHSVSHMRTLFLKQFSEGKFGEHMTIEAEDEEGNVFTESVSMQSFQEIIMEQALNPQQLQNAISFCQVKEYNGGIGYVRLFTFQKEEVVKEMQKALEKLSDKDALIVDVRDNDGGVVGYATAITEMLAIHACKIGSYVKRKEDSDVIEYEEPSEIQIGSRGFSCKYEKIILLCNEFTMSSAEFIFLKALQGTSKKIVVVGTKTGGLAHRASIYTLFDGTKIQITTSKYLDLDGNIVPEEGIIPDRIVENSVRILTLNKDEQLEYALALCTGKIT